MRARVLLTTAVVALVVAGCGAGSPFDAVQTTEPPQQVSNDAVFPADAERPELADVVAPAGSDSTGGIPVSKAGVGVVGDGDVVIAVYFDFICPYCGVFERVHGPYLDELVAAGGVTVVYHPVALFDHFSDTAYSTRAMNAVAVVADLDPQHVPAFIAALLSEEVQPDEGASGLTDEQIAQVAQGVGVSPAVTAAFTATADFNGALLRLFVPWTVAATWLIPVEDGKVGTPTIVINGERMVENWTDQGVFAAAIEAARS
ncbi:MAG: thioredoxin domain-containing protein [Micrococcales bacterium]|nr:thioredoxin domain-containing protein [Micrococcales bacterium]